MRKAFALLLGFLLVLNAGNAFGQRRSHAHKKRPTVVLVLGGGGAKGAAEVGVLKEIEKAGVPIDFIVGTSIGSIVGGLYSLGYSADDLDSLFCNQNWPALFNDAKAKDKTKLKEVAHGFGLLRGHSIVGFLDSLIAYSPANLKKGGMSDSIAFDRMPIPYRAVASDIRTGTAVVLSHGELSIAMRASMSIPGAFKPVEIDTTLLMDGGLINNLPTDVARALGADYIIAVDLTQNKHPDYKPKKIKKFMLREVKWLRTRPDFVNYNRNRQDCDIYINPTLKGYGVTSFNAKAIRAMIDIGQEAAAAKHRQLVKLRKKVKGR